jgi:flagellar biosynthesis/type III secretory pathway ATPase
MDSVVSESHRGASRRVRGLLAVYEEKRDLIALGAYTKGTDARADEAIAAQSRIEQFLRQDSSDLASFEQTQASLQRLATPG